MARDWTTTYSASSALSTHTANFPSPAIAGRKLLAVGVAPASIDSPAGWTEIAEANDTSGDLSVSMLSAAGGETSITWVRESGASTASRTFAGWVESRDDIGPLHGTAQVYPNPSGSNSVGLAPIVTTIDGCRVYVIVATINDPVGTWTPTFTGAPLVLEEMVTGAAFSFEPVRLAVASCVVGVGSHNISIASIPVSASTIIAFAVEPSGTEPPPAAETVVEAENRNLGIDKNVWDVSGGGDPTIHGFTTSMSVAVGSSINMKVHSPSAWTGKVYRAGWYGSRGAREVGTISGTATTQPTGTTDSTTGMVSCANWTVNGSWAVPSDVAPGVYFIKIFRNDLTTAASHIGPFVVTDPNRKAKIVVKLSDSTWQAYNHAGANPADIFNGKNLYGQGTASGFTFDQASRCKAVSYDRPLITRKSIPQTSFWNAEYPLVRWFERLGYDVDYVTCAQVDADPSLLLGREVVVSSGHDEYWSEGMWDAFTGARDNATQSSNLVFLSGNEAFWRIRFASDHRSFACWKDSHEGVLNSSGLYSGTWQDTRTLNTGRRTAALLNGQRFRLNGIASFPMAVPATFASSPLWRGTDVASLTTGQTWTSPVGIVGFEADEPADVNPNEKPTGLIRLSQVTHQVSGGLSDDNGATYNGSGSFTHAITAYRNPQTSAAVFAFGTVQYAWGLDDIHDRAGASMVTPVLQQALTNLIADLGVTPPAYPLPSDLTMPTPVSLNSYNFPSIPPSAPSGLSAIPAQTSVALEWAASTGDVAGYRIYRDAVLVVEVAASPTSYVASGLSPQTAYAWYVKAVNSSGVESSSSNVVNATTLNVFVPTPLNPLESVTTAKLLRKAFEDFKAAVESGTVTGGISPTLFNAKGDLLAASANDTPIVIPSGTNGQFLSADSSSPAGLKWATPPQGGSGPGGGEPVVDPGTVSQYYRGDKTWQTLSKIAVGLPNVDNTADAQKPVSAAQDTADKKRPVLKLWNGSSYIDVSAGTIFLGGTTDPTTKPGDIWIESA